MINHGSLVISLDFEMMWGCHDWSTPQGYGITNVKQVKFVIDRMLNLFGQFGVHATFATVGMIMCKNKDDVLDNRPERLPSYLNENLSPYKGTYIADINTSNSDLYFAADVIDRLKHSDGVEIGTHTFCHFFCWEKGQTPQQFKADLERAKVVANENGIAISSIVFPKNQVSKEYLDICWQEGIKSYRGNAVNFFSVPKTRWESIKNRICRLLDAYLNIGGMTGTPYTDINIDENPLNLRASRMLRPYSQRLFIFEGLRFRRIQKEMIHAARHNEMYHLWWHPHNFGANMEQNLAFLEKVLKCYKECHNRYGMQSYTMNEMREQLLINR